MGKRCELLDKFYQLFRERICEIKGPKQQLYLLVFFFFNLYGYIGKPWKKVNLIWSSIIRCHC